METLDVAGIYYVTRKLQAELEAFLGTQGVLAGGRTPLHRRAVIRDIVESPGSFVGEIAERLHVAQSIVSKTVFWGREAGLLVTDVDPVDRRRTRVHPSGRLSETLAARLGQPAASLLDPLFDGVDDRDYETFLRVLCDLHHRFKTSEPT